MAKLSRVPAGRERSLDLLAGRARDQQGSENFPVALRILPRDVRRDLLHVYTFARFVDDVGDEFPGTPDERLALLDVVGDEVTALATGTARLGPVAALAGLTRAGAVGEVPLQPFLDLVEANRVDQRTDHYETFAELLGYCRLSAQPVGQIVLYRAGAATPDNLADSNSVCAGLQVLEHCQDVGEDARAGRIYLPRTDLRAAGVAAGELSGSVTTPALRSVVGIQVGRARHLLESGRALVPRLHGWARIAVAGYIAGGLATADALDAARYDVLGAAVRPSKVRTARHVAALLSCSLPGWRR